MSLLDSMKELVRPELEVDPAIVEREEKFRANDPNREQWINDHTYLWEGDLETLVEHSGYNEFGISTKFAYFPGKQPKKVIVQVEIADMFDDEMNISIERKAIKSAEKKLKYELCIRGCNSGIFYRRYVKNGFVFAEATPAMLTGE